MSKPNELEAVDIATAAEELRAARESEDHCDLIDDWAERWADDLVHTLRQLRLVHRRDVRARNSLTLYVKQAELMVSALGDLVIAQDGAETVPVKAMQAAVAAHFPQMKSFAWTAEGFLLYDKESEVKAHADKRLKEWMIDATAHAGQVLSDAEAERRIKSARKGRKGRKAGAWSDAMDKALKVN